VDDFKLESRGKADDNGGYTMTNYVSPALTFWFTEHWDTTLKSQMVNTTADGNSFTCTNPTWDNISSCSFDGDLLNSEYGETSSTSGLTSYETDAGKIFNQNWIATPGKSAAFLADSVGQAYALMTTSGSTNVENLGGAAVKLDNSTVGFIMYFEPTNGDNFTLQDLSSSSNLRSISSTAVDNLTLSYSEQMGGSIQGGQLSLSTVVTTLAGTGSHGSANGTGTSASFNAPFGVTTDGTNLYVADYGNHLIRKIVISTGAVTTLAGTGSSGSANGTGTSASFNYPGGITTDGTNLYVTDEQNHLIRKIVISTGAVTTVAGTGSSGSANGTGTSASFHHPAGITTDGTNLYVSDYENHLIRKIVISTGAVTTVAGTGSQGSANGTGTSASFYKPTGITTDGTNLYVSDLFNFLIRKIVISTGAVTTVAGTGSQGSANGTGTSASFGGPWGITTDGTNLYVADFVNHSIRQVVISSGVVTTVAGTGSSGSANGTGTSASFNQPVGITTDGTNLYVADYSNELIRQVE
jgi:hypothetical protein